MQDALKEERDVEERALVSGVSQVVLEGFRNYAHLELQLSPGFNVLAGPNAQGKTNFLEALYLLATTRLLRGQKDAEAIMDGRQAARVSAELLALNTRLSILLERGIRKRAALNGLNLPRASDLIGRLPCVCISSVDLSIVKGEPTDRRMFLDLELSALYPSYLRHLTLYKRALEQRNALLRDSRDFMKPAASFEPWELQLAHHGAAIRIAREEFVERLSPLAEAAHGGMGQGEPLALSYAPKDEAIGEDVAYEALASSRATDVARGGTSVGPHRDDLNILIGGREGRLFGSQGQQRTGVISLKLATLDLIEQELGLPPLLLLDDILSDLDESRRTLLIARVTETPGQAVLTCTEASAAGEHLLSRAKVFNVQAGTVSEDGES